MPSPPTMTVDQFVEKWSNTSVRENQGSQTHFNDLCAMLGVETPIEADPTGETYCFEKRVVRPDGSVGTADVWKRGYFGWEYKGQRKSLTAAYAQLSGYRDGLENPPLLVVSDMNRFEIHTAFEKAPARQINFNLKDLRNNPTHFTRILRDAFLDAGNLHPHNDPRYITEEAANRFGEVASTLRERDGHDAAVVSRFLNRIIFCLFAEGVRLFDYEGRRHRPVSELLETLATRAELARAIIRDLFNAMAEQSTPNFGLIPIRWFNGGLFDQNAAAETIALTGDLVTVLQETSEFDWSKIDPAVFGTLFERGLDPKRRGQLGAHFTDAGNIMRVVQPVIMRPLRREFEQLKQECSDASDAHAVGDSPQPAYGRLSLPTDGDETSPAARIRRFHDRLANVRVLDPACGSGNFLYVAMRELKTLEHELIDWAKSAHSVNGLNRRVGPQNMLGIDIDPFAVDLTRMSLWIGDLQWGYERNLRDLRDPVLGAVEQIECRDAILAEDESGDPVPAQWPDADIIIGNPPFLGMKKMRDELDAGYVERLSVAYGEEMDARADLCVYWHEVARRQIERGASRRAGLLATSSISAPFSRPVLQRIADSGGIFFGYSDEPWVNDDGAAVRIAIVGQDDGSETDYVLDGEHVSQINPNLTSGPYVVHAPQLAENARVAFQGDIRNGRFDIPFDDALRMLNAPINVNGRPNRDVVFPFVNARDLAQRPRDRHVIDFGQEMSRRDAARYELPFGHVRKFVRPERAKSQSKRLRDNWWLHESWRPGMRSALGGLDRFIGTPITSRHRFHVWLDGNVTPDATVVAIARDDDYAFGVLHSRIHEAWAVAQGSRLGVGNDLRYVHTQCFNTFPFPWPLDTPDADLTIGQQTYRDAIAEAGRALDADRSYWLNPTGVNPMLLQDRTITALYNELPPWLFDLHDALDEAVAAAYGWPVDLDDEEILDRLLDLNRERAGV